MFEAELDDLKDRVRKTEQRLSDAEATGQINLITLYVGLLQSYNKERMEYLRMIAAAPGGGVGAAPTPTPLAGVAATIEGAPTPRECDRMMAAAPSGNRETSRSDASNSLTLAPSHQKRREKRLERKREREEHRRKAGLPKPLHYENQRYKGFKDHEREAIIAYNAGKPYNKDHIPEHPDYHK